MLKKWFALLLLYTCSFMVAQEIPKAYKVGEWLQYKMSYSGFLRAGTAELALKEKVYKDKKVYIHLI